MEQRPINRLVAKLSKIACHPIASIGSLILVYVIIQFIEKRFWERQTVSEFWPMLVGSIAALADDPLAHVALALVALWLLWQGGHQVLKEERRLAEQHDEQLEREAEKLAKPVVALIERYDRRLLALQDYVVLQERQKVIEQIMAKNEEQLWAIRGFTENTVKIVPADEKSPMARDHINSLFRKIDDWQMKVQMVLTTQDWFSEDDKASTTVNAQDPLMGGVDEAKNLEGDDRLRYCRWIVRQRAVSNMLTAKATETTQKMQEASNIFRRP